MNDLQSRMFFEKLKDTQILHYVPTFEGYGFVRGASGNCIFCSYKFPWEPVKSSTEAGIINWFNSLPKILFLQQDETMGSKNVRVDKNDLKLIVKKLYSIVEDL